MTGHVKIDADGRRTDFQLHVMELKKDVGFQEVWIEFQELNWIELNFKIFTNFDLISRIEFDLNFNDASKSRIPWKFSDISEANLKSSVEKNSTKCGPQKIGRIAEISELSEIIKLLNFRKKTIFALVH